MSKKFFYVSAIDGKQKFLVSGPYPSHAAALSQVDAIKEKASKIDGRADFMAWGTAGSNKKFKTPLGGDK